MVLIPGSLCYTGNVYQIINNLFGSVFRAIRAETFLSGDVLAEHCLVGNDLLHYLDSLLAVGIFIIVFCQVKINLVKKAS